MRRTVLVGKIGPAFTGTHSQYSKIGTRFDFTHTGDVEILIDGYKECGFWNFGQSIIPADVIFAAKQGIIPERFEFCCRQAQDRAAGFSATMHDAGCRSAGKNL